MIGPRRAALCALGLLTACHSTPPEPEPEPRYEPGNAILEVRFELGAEVQALAVTYGGATETLTVTEGDPRPVVERVEFVEDFTEGGVFDPSYGARELRLSARWCETSTGDACEAAIVIGRPFYLGRRTFVTIPIPPECHETPCVVAIDKCDVRGCLAGEQAESYCVGDAGEHACEVVPWRYSPDAG